MSGDRDDGIRGAVKRCLPAPVGRAGRRLADLARLPAARHRAMVPLRAWLAGVRWRKQRRNLGPAPIVGISLVEHLGDVIAAEPVIRYLRREHPRARLVWVVARPYAFLLRDHPDLDGVLELGCLSEWIRLRERPLFDRLIDLQLHGRRCLTCQIPLERPPSERRVTIRNYYDDGGLLHAFCCAAGLPPLTDGPRLHLPARARAAADQLDLPPRFLVIHGLSNQAVRDWRPERWRVLVERTVALWNLTVVEVGLHSALDRRPDVADARYIDLCGRLDLATTTAVIARATLFAGIDSGPAHVANAAAVPGVVLLGHYRHYQRYTPYSGGYANGSNATLVRNPDGPAADLPVETVLAAMQRHVSAHDATEVQP